MNIDDQVPVLVAQVLEADIPKNTGIVEEDIHTTIGLYGSFDDLLTARDTVVICYRFAASGFDLVDNYIRSLRILEYAYAYNGDQV